MGKCRVCGRWAGVFSDEHPECAERAQEEAEREKAIAARAAEVLALMKSAPEGAVAIEELAPLIATIADENSEIPWRGFERCLPRLSRHSAARALQYSYANRTNTSSAATKRPEVAN